MKVDVEIVTEDGQLKSRLADSSEVMQSLLQRAELVGGAKCLPLIRSDRPTEFRNADLVSLLADFVALQDVARTRNQQGHLESVCELLHEALDSQGCTARFTPQGELS